MNIRGFFCVALLLSFSPLRVWAQTDHLQDELNSAYKGKTLLLRNFYSGGTLAYGSDGQLHKPSIQGPWTLGGLEITDIVVAEPGIEIRGNRMGAVFKNGKLSFMKVGKLQIHIDRDNPEKNLDAAIRHIFIDPKEDLRPLLPDYWQSYLSGSDSKSRKDAWISSIEKRDPSASPPVKVSPGAVSAPRAIHLPEPKYTKEAASRQFEGMSRLMVVVNTSGSAENIAILDPLGMGLDEQAVKAVQQWRFQPGMKDGQPIWVQIEIEVDFRCCPFGTDNY
jgi:TonB family protein